MTAPTAPLQLSLLGPFNLAYKGQRLVLAYEKGRALLAFLASHSGRTYSRAYLATLLWPNLERATALANLRLVLHNLRPQINRASDAAGPLLHIGRDTVTLPLDARLYVDTTAFLADTPACTRVPQPGFCAACLASMAQRATLYGGEFLQGFSLPDCPDFEDWIFSQREALLQRALARLTALSDCHERGAAYAEALPFAQRFSELDPWNEHGCRRVIRLLALCGQRDFALAYYEKWCNSVKVELGLLPSEETRTLADNVRCNALTRTGRRSTDALAKAPLVSTPIAQRRQVTVLHCALEVNADADPDAALLQLRGPQERFSEIIRAHSGYLVQAHGGSLLAYFGYPHATENAAQQAVRAALALRREALTGLEVRIGVHTGMVISGGEPDVPDAIGATSGVAIRLRQRIHDHEIAISRATYQLVAGYFDCTPLQPPSVDHHLSQSDAFCVVQENGVRDRLDAATTLTPLVGRSHELSALHTLWQEASQKNTRAVLLQGEAGIGKSRMAVAFKEAIQHSAMAITELRCLPEHSQTPFQPLVALFHTALGFVTSDTPQMRLQKLADYVQAQYPNDQQDVLTRLASLLSLSLHGPHSQTPATSPQQREKMLCIVLDRLYAMATPGPLFLLIEDVHWADPSSLELLQRIVANTRPHAILAIFTARPHFHPPWDAGACTAMVLGTLDNTEAQVLIGTLDPTLPPTVVQAIIQRADGIPLFVEELAKQTNAHDLSVIPSTLQDLLAARLDAMGAAKLVAQHAATIGRVFHADLLIRVSHLNDETLGHALCQLQAAGLMHRTTPSEYQFAHALLCDAAYQSQTRPERETMHLRIATALQTDGQARPELLAQHWAAGGDIRTAARCWFAASQLSSQQSANKEAILHCKAGLALLATLPEDPERIRLELDLQIKLGAAACATQGYTCAQGAAAYARAIDLCAQHTDSPDMFTAMWGLWASASLRVHYHHSLELAQQLLRMAEQRADAVHFQQAHFALGVTYFRLGDLVTAHTQFQHVQQLYTPDQHARHVAAFGEDAGVASGSHRSGALWALGYPQQALHASAQTVAYARQLGHPFSLAYALNYAMLLHCQLRQPDACLALADETLALANRHGFALWQVGAVLSRGWAMAQMQAPQGVQMMQHCINSMRAALGSVELFALVPLASAYVTLGDADHALAVIDEAFSTGSAKADHHLDAELYRLKGEALFIQSSANTGQAEECFETALAISRMHHALVFELRANMGLVRLCLKKRKAQRAHGLLVATYGVFKEGFDTPDLCEARQLIGRTD